MSPIKTEISATRINIINNFPDELQNLVFTFYHPYKNLFNNMFLREQKFVSHFNKPGEGFTIKTIKEICSPDPFLVRPDMIDLFIGEKDGIYDIINGGYNIDYGRCDDLKLIYTLC